MRDVRTSLARIEATLSATLPTLATAAQVTNQVGGLRAELAGTRGDLGGEIRDISGSLGGQISELRGSRVATLPTAWQMMTAVVAGQCTLAALLAAIVFGVLKVTGHG